MRRERRPLHTPPQMTTLSEPLPVYAKEPGEQELVVLQQCPAYMESLHIPLPHVHRPPTPYPSMPDSPPSPSFTENNIPADVSFTNLPTTSHRRTGTGDQSTDTSSISFLTLANLVDLRNPTSSDRSEAPPYFEAVDANHSDITSAGSHDASTSGLSPATSSSSPPSSQKRRTNIRSLLKRISTSAASYGSSFASAFRPPPREQPQTNDSQTKISTLPRRASTMISLNPSSISSPLTYTTVRTGFASPKGARLTADQMRMVYSVDNLVRFGVPYGPDAVAFASSSLLSSRNGLVWGEEMRVGFEEMVVPSGGGITSH